jgi:hypothetical protein
MLYKKLCPYSIQYVDWEMDGLCSSYANAMIAIQSFKGMYKYIALGVKGYYVTSFHIRIKLMVVSLIVIRYGQAKEESCKDNPKDIAEDLPMP